MNELKKIAVRSQGYFGDPYGYEEFLFETASQCFILFGQGGQTSIYAEAKIMELSRREAHDWLVTVLGKVKAGEICPLTVAKAAAKTTAAKSTAKKSETAAKAVKAEKPAKTVKAEAAKAVKAEPAKAEPVKAEPVKAEKPEAAKTKSVSTPAKPANKSTGGKTQK